MSQRAASALASQVQLSAFVTPAPPLVLYSYARAARQLGTRYQNLSFFFSSGWLAIRSFPNLCKVGILIQVRTTYERRDFRPSASKYGIEGPMQEKRTTYECLVLLQNKLTKAPYLAWLKKQQHTSSSGSQVQQQHKFSFWAMIKQKQTDSQTEEGKS